MNIINFFKGLFSRLARIFKAFLAEAIPLIIQIIIAELKDFAIETVNDLEATSLDTREKRNEAFFKIKEYAKKNGIEAKDSIINLVIELALQHVRNF